MIEHLSIPKRYGTYADECLALGLAEMLSLAQRQIHNLKDVTLSDQRTSYRVSAKKALEPEVLAKELAYESLFQPVKGDKTEAISGLDWDEMSFFDTRQATETRKRFLEFQRLPKKDQEQLSEDDIPPSPDARTQNGVILTYMRHDRNHNALWKAGYDIKQHFGPLVASVLQAFDGNNLVDDPIAQAAIYFKQYSGEKLPADASAVKIFLSTFVQGVNRPKADTNKVDSSGQKEPWLLLWLIAAGLFNFGFAERIKISDNTFDWRVLMLEPKEISLSSYRDVLDKLRILNPPSGAHGVARFDAELSIRLSKGLLEHHPARDPGQPRQKRSRSPSTKEMVSGFSGTHFVKKNQVYGVKEIFSLGLPDWIRPSSYEEVLSYQQILDEHLAVVRSLSIDDGNGELLSAYRDFITGNELDYFFNFHRSYADYIVRQLADPKVRYAPKRFSQQGLDIMTQSLSKSDQDWSVSEITQNKGFQRIARAINSATVYAGKIKTKQGPIELDWQRTYGLAQRLGNHAGSKKDFIAELSAFLLTYENENLRIQDKLQKEGKPLKRVWVTNEDLEDFLKLLDDKRFGCNLVANLLLAYGYAQWKRPLQTEAGDTPIVESDEVAETSDNE
jgi:hypothetical protein